MLTASPPTLRKPLLVIGGALVDGTGRSAELDAAVLAADGRIRAVGSRSEVTRDPLASDADVIDGVGGTIIPGLIDGHTHLALSREGGTRWPPTASSDATYAWALSNALLALASGITTVRDCGAPSSILSLRRAIEEDLHLGPRIIACGPWVTTTGGHGASLGVTADTADDLRRRVRELVEQEVDFIKVMATGGLSSPWSNRRQPQYTLLELQALTDDAHRLQRQVVAHANATEGIRRAVRAGVDTVAHCNWLGPEEGRLEYDPQVADAMAAAGIFVDLNVTGALRPLESDGLVGGPGAEPRNRWELFADMRRRGVQVFLTSDALGAEIRTFADLLITAQQQWELQIEDVIYRATGLAARALGIADDRGTLAPGKRADFVLLDGRVDTDPTALRRVRGVWLAGERVYSDRPRR